VRGLKQIIDNNDYPIGKSSQLPTFINLVIIIERL